MLKKRVTKSNLYYWLSPAWYNAVLKKKKLSIVSYLNFCHQWIVIRSTLSIVIMIIDTLYDEKRSSPSSLSSPSLSWLNLRHHDDQYLIRREERLRSANGHVRSTAGGIVLRRKYFYMMMRYSHMMIWWNMLIWRDCVAHTHSCSWRQNHKCDNLQPSMSIWHQDQSGGWIWKLFDISCIMSF